MKNLKNILLGSVLLMPLFSIAQINYGTPLIPTSQWSNYELHLINLDKNDKPQGATKIDFSKEAIVDHKELSVSVFPNELDKTGKVLRFTCKKNDVVLTQKFGNPEQVKGFALQMTCDKVKYYFIVNPK